jgi:nucleotide-binding universal stress UspA family protein
LAQPSLRESLGLVNGPDTPGFSPIYLKLKAAKMKKILIALDYNPSAQKVAEEGFALAKAMNAEVTLLHVVSDPVYYSTEAYSPIMGFNGYMETGQMQLNSVDSLKSASLHFLDKTRQHLGDKTIQTLVEEGDYAESILKVAKEMHADIIIIGSHSRKWLENIVMGSVTEKVLRNTSIPLFIIPVKQKMNP